MGILDIDDDEAVAAFAQSCGVPVETLRSVITEVGPAEFDIRNHLHKMALRDAVAKISTVNKPTMEPDQTGLQPATLEADSDSAKEW